MKQQQIIKIICALILTLTAGDTAKAQMTDRNDKAQLEQTYAEMYRAMIAKDTASLGCLLDDDFVLVHMTGMRQPKQEYLRAIADGTLNYYSCDDTMLDISVEGDSARMTGRSRVDAAVFGGGRRTWSLKLTIDLEKRDSRWLMKLIKAGTY